MSAAVLRMIPTQEDVSSVVSWDEKLADHHAILDGYFDTFITQGYSDTSIHDEPHFIHHWFKSQCVTDGQRTDSERHLLVWEAMAPITGQERIASYIKSLMMAGLKRTTVMSYAGRLRRLFTYVLERPYIPGTAGQMISAKYGRIEQPISRYDYPKHHIEQEREGFVLTGERLYDFYSFIRDVYVPANQKQMTAWRDYTMVVIAAESGLRADELCHLDAQGLHRDLFYDENRIQTRHGKGSRGSGKRTRQTIFTPFAQATARMYEAHVRPQFRNASTHPALFLAETGQRMNYGVMWYSLHKIVEAARDAGLEMPPQLMWHDLRRSFVTGYVKRVGRDEGGLLKMVGHQSPSTLWKYVRYTQEECNEMMDRYYQTLLSPKPQDDV